MGKQVKKQNIFNYLSEIYIVTILFFFIFVMNKNTYYQVLECKWSWFVFLSLTYIISCTCIYIYKLIIKKDNYFKNYHLSLNQKLALLFLIIIFLSCTFSPYIKSSKILIGEYRYEGLITYTLYITTYLYLTFFLKFNKRFYTYFAISALIISLITFFQHNGVNIFNLYHTKEGLKNGSYMATIGNIDTLSALYTIYIPVIFGSSIFINKKIILKIIDYIALLFSFYVVLAINVDSGKLALLLTLILFMPLFIKKGENLKKLSINISAVFGALALSKLNFIFLLLAVFFLIFGIKVNLQYEITNKINKLYFICLLISLLAGLIVIYFCKFNNNLLYEIHEILHGNFDDSFGTYRLFLWKRTLPLIKEYPILGSGPDTFAIRFMKHYTSDVISLGYYSVNDTAANNYLTMLINYGIVGLLAYLLFIVSIIKRLIKSVSKEKYVFMVAIICFLIQDFFNLWVVIVTPIWFMLLAIASSINNSDKKAFM